MTITNVLTNLVNAIAIRFAEWIHKNGYRKSRIEGVFWTTEDTHKHLSTQEIYDLFLAEERAIKDAEIQQRIKEQELIEKIRNQ